MGTWDTGLFDNDGALDLVDDLLDGADLDGEGPKVKRDPAVAAILGRYRTDLDGRLAGGAPPGLVQRCATTLDGLAEYGDLYEGADALAALGLLVLTGRPDLPAGAVARWRAAFDAIDAATTGERSFWDVYAGKVRAAFDRLERG